MGERDTAGLLGLLFDSCVDRGGHGGCDGVSKRVVGGVRVCCGEFDEVDGMPVDDRTRVGDGVVL